MGRLASLGRGDDGRRWCGGARGGGDDEPAADDDIVEQVRAATELLESVARDPSVLEALSEAERIRLRQAAAEVFSPSVELRRRHVRARQRRERAERIRRDEAVLDRTGIRKLRERPVFTTPNVFPPDGFAPR